MKKMELRSCYYGKKTTGYMLQTLKGLVSSKTKKKLLLCKEAYGYIWYKHLNPKGLIREYEIYCIKCDIYGSPLFSFLVPGQEIIRG